MNKEITISAKAKINLTLEIFDKRRDGYHEMRSIMHKIGLCDTVKITLNTDSTANNNAKIKVNCSKYVCEEPDNLAYKAAQRYLEAYEQKSKNTFSCNIEIQKNIPEQAGLGGGSADCAAVLDGLSSLVGTLTESEIQKIAASLGADVPFMQQKHSCSLATGVGTSLKELPMMPKCLCVIGKPSAGLSTRDIYDLFDEKRNVLPSVKTNSLIAALEQEDFVGICNNISNQFEPICVNKISEIGKIKKQLLKHGAFAAQMSGSGSAVYGIFTQESAAQAACKALENLPFETYKTVCTI